MSNFNAQFLGNRWVTKAKKLVGSVKAEQGSTERKKNIQFNPHQSYHQSFRLQHFLKLRR